MYPNALVTLGLILSDVRMDLALASSVNRSLFESPRKEPEELERLMLSMQVTATNGMTDLQNLYRHRRNPLVLAPEQEEYFHAGSTFKLQSSMLS